MNSTREQGRVLMTADWVVGHENGQHVLLPQGEVVFEEGEIVFVGHGFAGEVARRTRESAVSTEHSSSRHALAAA